MKQHGTLFAILFTWRKGSAIYNLFSIKRKIRRWRSYAGIFHLLSLIVAVMFCGWYLPQQKNGRPFQSSVEMQRREENRQLLLEALDRLARFEKYFYELNGRYTRDLSRLQLPSKLSMGSVEEIKRNYEISVLEMQPNRFLLLATGIGSHDRVTIDERHRVNANFSVPMPSKSYLLEEADRMLRLKELGKAAEEGFYSRFWQVQYSESFSWYAIGLKPPVKGEKRILLTARPSSLRVPSSTDSNVENDGKTLAKLEWKEDLDIHDVHDWLGAAKLAQHVFLKEYGSYANRWDDLDRVSDYHFSERMRLVKNIRVHPIELPSDGTGFRIVMEGTSGDLMGEQFLLDSGGQVRQVRYTEALIQQLQKSTNFLENSFNFQIKPMNEDPKFLSRP